MTEDCSSQPMVWSFLDGARLGAGWTVAKAHVVEGINEMAYHYNPQSKGCSPWGATKRKFGSLQQKSFKMKQTKIDFG